MKFERFVSDPPVSPYAPQWDFRVGNSMCEDIDTNSLSKFLLSKESEVKKIPVQHYDLNDGYGKRVFDGYTGLGSNSTTSRSLKYNIFSWNHPEIRKLKSNIAKNIILYNNECGNKTPQLWIQGWYNILRFGQSIKPHGHSVTPDCYLSGHFDVQVNDTSTVYMSPINQLNDPEVINIKNILGKLTLFPSYIFHYTTPHYSFKSRITIAFDINSDKLNDNFLRL